MFLLSINPFTFISSFITFCLSFLPAPVLGTIVTILALLIVLAIVRIVL